MARFNNPEGDFVYYALFLNSGVPVTGSRLVSPLSPLRLGQTVSGRQGTSSKHGGGTAGNSGETSVSAPGEPGAPKGNDPTGRRGHAGWSAPIAPRIATRARGSRGHGGGSRKS